MCNNTLFNQETMPAMHESMVRLYKIAFDAEKIQGSSALAARLITSPQRVKNWEYRGVSEAGAIQAQKVFGCDVNVLLGRAGHTYQPNKKAASLVANQQGPTPWNWPFREVTPDKWALLDQDEKDNFEKLILATVKNRGDPEKTACPRIRTPLPNQLSLFGATVYCFESYKSSRALYSLEQ